MVELVSGLHVKLIGVEPNRTDVEMFIKNGFLGKSVTLIPDSKGDQEITDPNGTIGAYVILNDTHECLNHLVVIQYPQTYRAMDLSDSTGWVKGKIPPTPKPDLALYMKQRTFLIEVNTEEAFEYRDRFLHQRPRSCHYQLARIACRSRKVLYRLSL